MCVCDVSCAGMGDEGITLYIVATQFNYSDT